jgi:23S rRNA (uracil1939-C5)-methyltransferase
MSSSTKSRRAANRVPLELELRLGDFVTKGATGADVNGRPVAIDRGIPGELVRVSIDRRRRDWRGVVDTVVESSHDRVVPSCPAYEAGCGGCQWQHMSYPTQIAAKQALVDREMERAGAKIRVSATHAMDRPWRYRRTAAIALGWEAGFRPRGRRGIVEIRDCPISHPLIGCLADELNNVLRAGRIPPYHGKVWLDCTVVGLSTEPALQIVIQGIEGLTLESHPELPDVAATLAGCGSVQSVSFRHRSGVVLPLIGELEKPIEVAGKPMWVPAGAFVQTNAVMLDRLIANMEPAIEARSPVHVADVYGGIGTFALSFADRVQHMTLIELDVSAVAAAQHTACDRNLTNMSFVSQPAERALRGLAAVDLIIVDPPRSGLGSVVTAALGESGARSIMYVSCSPSSLARDLAELDALGFTASSLHLFDFYPHTYHVECLTTLDRRT